VRHEDFRCAIEIRNAGLLGPDYRKVLEHHGVAHVYNHWSYMPSLREQHQRMEEHFTAPFTVLRLLTPLKMSYEAAKKRAARYGRTGEKMDWREAKSLCLGEEPQRRKCALDASIFTECAEIRRGTNVRLFRFGLLCKQK